MDTAENVNQNVEIQKLSQLLTKNIDNFKYLVLCNMRLGKDSMLSNESPHVNVNRISDFQQQTTESLEEWVARQRVKPRNTRSSGTLIDFVEQWLMNEAKKDLFVEMDAIYGGPQGLSSVYIRELGLNLISLADKLEAMKSRTK